MLPIDRIILYLQALALAITLVIVGGTASYVVRTVEPLLKTAGEVKDTADRVRLEVEGAIERLKAWENRWRRLGVPSEEEALSR